MKVDTTLTGANSLVFATYLGGDQSDVAYDVAIDPLGRAVVAGDTFSTSPAGRRQVPARAAGGQLPDVRAAHALRHHLQRGWVAPSTFVVLRAPARRSTAWRRARPARSGGRAAPATSRRTRQRDRRAVVNAEQATYGRGFAGTGGARDAAHRPHLAVHRPVRPSRRRQSGAAGRATDVHAEVTNAGSETASSVVVVRQPAGRAVVRLLHATTAACAEAPATRARHHPSRLAAGASSTITHRRDGGASVGAGQQYHQHRHGDQRGVLDPVPANNTATRQRVDADARADAATPTATASATSSRRSTASIRSAAAGATAPAAIPMATARPTCRSSRKARTRAGS